MAHGEVHRTQRVGWLRAAVLGANDGIVSTASLIIGVAASDVTRSAVIVSGMAGLVAGAMSMAAGEYVSVSSQSDTERADVERERAELSDDPDRELDELTEIYAARGLDDDLARRVAAQLMSHDALGAHTRDELGISETVTARPVQAALTSAATFAVGAVVPLLAALTARGTALIVVVAATALLALAVLGGLGARVGGAPVARGISRVVFWGALAMALTALIGSVFGAVV